MNATEPPNSFRYFVIGVLCVAVVLGVYFVRHNAQVDRDRELANERRVLCLQVENLARSLLADSIDMCGQLNEPASKTSTTL